MPGQVGPHIRHAVVIQDGPRIEARRRREQSANAPPALNPTARPLAVRGLTRLDASDRNAAGDAIAG